MPVLPSWLQPLSTSPPAEKNCKQLQILRFHLFVRPLENFKRLSADRCSLLAPVLSQWEDDGGQSVRHLLVPLVLGPLTKHVSLPNFLAHKPHNGRMPKHM